ncbi:PhzF family phenazine biosynthesis protein [Martelella sp. HB161492]|uniref:PhzF family phenazine biosynthesis protein n=1 Tax=Martelella sp. HB161492 TaxID=2720726 RepID=UPI0015903D54|nr:PhzF family phenazine biosynthesis protein [Martelella sp. HB161492]
MALDFAIYDVFTDHSLAGNPLAVVFDADALSDDAMAAIARQFNLSETIFFKASENRSQTATARIFTPGGELPFAGHPTVGGAIALAERNREGDAAVDMVSVLAEKVGPVRCAVKLRPGKTSFAEFDLPQLSRQARETLDRAKLAEMLGLEPAMIGFENHVPTLWSAGVPFICIPVTNLRTMEAIDFDTRVWRSIAPLVDGRLASPYIYTRGGVRHDSSFHARMFSGDMGIAEDPATGSAAAAFSGAIHHFDQLGDGHHAVLIEQGVEMGRPSYIHLHIDVESGAISGARIGGFAACTMRGTFLAA